MQEEDTLIHVAAVTEIGANARATVVSPYVRHVAAVGGRVQAYQDQEETDDAAAAADAPAAGGGNEVFLSNGEVYEEVTGGEDDEEVLRPNGAADATVNSIEDVPTEHICMIAGEPPADGVHFNISQRNTWAHRQVWSRELIFRMIATRGVGIAVRELVHPSTQERIARDRAWAHVTAVSPELQAILHSYRHDLGLSPEAEDPINVTDWEQYNQTMEIVRSR